MVRKVEIPMEKWKEEMLWLTIIYRMLECEDQIPILTANTDFLFIEKCLNDMYIKGLIDPVEGSNHWYVTRKGEQLRDKMVGIYDQALKFEVFSTVHLAMSLGEDITDVEGNVLDHFYDPRFDLEGAPTQEMQEDFGTEDMRIAMMTYLTESMVKTGHLKEPLDPHRIVFIQKLAEGKLKEENIWFDLRLGKFFNEVEEIVRTQYKWTDVSDDLEEAENVMQTLYTAGLLEQRKRDGFDCSGCDIPLALFEMNADGKLTECPNPECKADFNPPLPEGDKYSCPRCDASVYTSQHSCLGCGALLDFGLPSGTIVTDTEVTEEIIIGDALSSEEDVVIWGGGYYGYQPYGYYDPWDPLVDVVALGVCCAILW
jgi:predicted transcriptional regulator